MYFQFKDQEVATGGGGVGGEGVTPAIFVHE